MLQVSFLPAVTQKVRSAAGSFARRARRALSSRSVALIVATASVVGLAAAGWSSGPSTYTVRAGDSLWAIATARGITVSQLAAANGLDPNAILPIGRLLTIPDGSGRSQSGAAAGSAASSSAPTAVFAGGAAGGCNVAVSSPAGALGSLADLVAADPALRQVQQLLSEWAGTYGIPLGLFEAVTWQESGWYQGAVSPTGAVGVGQIEPGTAQFVSQVLIGRQLNSYSLSDNIEMSAAYLAYLSRVEGSNVCATLAAYYEGPLELQTYGLLPDARVYVSDIEALIPDFT